MSITTKTDTSIALGSCCLQSRKTHYLW